jgi:hypothetical protein
MKTNKILKINSEGSLIEWNDRLRRFELTNRAWRWGDITPGYVRESKRNYKLNNKT